MLLGSTSNRAQTNGSGFTSLLVQAVKSPQQKCTHKSEIVSSRNLFLLFELNLLHADKK